MQYYFELGKLNLEPLEKAYGTIQTDEVVITVEWMQHVQNRHKEDYELLWDSVSKVVNNPDIIIKDEKNNGTIFMIGKVQESNLNVVVRVALSTDKKGLKNSIMTFYRLREKNLKKILGKNQVLYKKE